MRGSRLVLIIVAAALLLGGAAAVAGQSSSPRDALVIGCDEFAAAHGASGSIIERTVAVSSGKAFAITLCSNASTGFGWDAPTFAGPAPVDLVDRHSAASSGDLVGSAGSEVFTFRVASPGSATIGLTYSQPWAGGTKQAWTVRLTVVAS